MVGGVCGEGKEKREKERRFMAYVYILGMWRGVLVGVVILELGMRVREGRERKEEAWFLFCYIGLNPRLMTR